MFGLGGTLDFGTYLHGGTKPLLDSVIHVGWPGLEDTLSADAAGMSLRFPSPFGLCIFTRRHPMGA